jgi:diacylglycerol kinase family enzyme
MDRAGRRRITALLNAGSGTGQGPALAETVRGLLGRGDAAVEVREIARGASVDGAIAAAKAARPDVLVAGGGDGTVSAVAAALVDSDIVLGVLPLGTLNHFAKDLGIPLVLEAAAEAIVSGRTTRIDVGEVNGRVFINNSSIGLYPEIVRDRERQQGRGAAQPRRADLGGQARVREPDSPALLGVRACAELATFASLTALRQLRQVRPRGAS